MESHLEAAEFRPELISRRGEAIAWAGALLVGGAWLALILSGNGVNLLVPLLAIPLLLAALSISLGNWMDRHTRLRLDEDGIIFQNRLRNVQMKWAEIQQVRVFPAQWSKKVQVVGENAHFSFLTLGEVKFGHEVKGRVGFAAGETILKRILENSDLHEIHRAGPDQQQSGYYYARD
jgi:hypothetical protein